MKLFKANNYKIKCNENLKTTNEKENDLLCSQIVLCLIYGVWESLDLWPLAIWLNGSPKNSSAFKTNPKSRMRLI